MASKKTERRKRQKAGKEPINPTGVRIRKKPTPEEKRRIQASQVLNRLFSFILDDTEDLNERITMPPHKVSAALGILKKFYPDLAAVHKTTGDKEQTIEEWLDECEAKDKEEKV